MIKQIQLRGISRTPSDRMSDDGGLSESLNMYMDTAENAPAFVPEDISSELGLPDDLQADRIFIHKTANYENYIVVRDRELFAIAPRFSSDKLPILELVEDEEVQDIDSIGNTLIFTTNKSLHYSIFKDRAYSYLGTKVPFPYINFNPQYSDSEIMQTNNFSGWEQSEEEWNSESRNPNQVAVQYFWERYEEVYGYYKNKKEFLGPLFVRYVVKLYDESKLSSIPILINPKDVEITASAHHTKKIRNGLTIEDEGSLDINVQGFKLALEAHNIDSIEDWKDLITSIDIYVSRPLRDYIDKKKSVMSFRTDYTTSSPDSSEDSTHQVRANIRMTCNTEEALIQCSTYCFHVKEIITLTEQGEFLTDDMKELLSGKMVLDATILPEFPIEVSGDGLLLSDDMKHYPTISKRIGVYNNQLLLLNPTQTIVYDYNRPNAFEISGKSKTNNYQKFEFSYKIKGLDKDKGCRFDFSCDNREEYVYPFQIFPDNRADSIKIKNLDEGSSQEATYLVADMKRHPYLDCAYYLGDMTAAVNRLCIDKEDTVFPTDNVDEMENKMFVSELDDPFVFPINKRYTFQSKILNIAISTTALSQGQFGQFPLYVFTEDGIWTMETAADGSFISQKPLSREVCINPDSICSIDNAVVFITSKAVMMISGSQVVNISPYMNGRHYTPNESALRLIKEQEGFGQYVDVISDEDPFMKFMKDAKTAYDYTGQRLIFISPSNKGFQFVYKIDTQTWHKIAFQDLDLVYPLNSYPECLIQGTKEGKTIVYSLSTVLDASRNQNTAQGMLITRPFDLGMPDVFKTITKVKVRGDFNRGDVKFILQGSDDGRNFFTLNSLRGKSWKMFRIFILADLLPTERISWIDIDFEPRYQDKLR